MKWLIVMALYILMHALVMATLDMMFDYKLLPWFKEGPALLRFICTALWPLFALFMLACWVFDAVRSRKRV